MNQREKDEQALASSLWAQSDAETRDAYVDGRQDGRRQASEMLQRMLIERGRFQHISIAMIEKVIQELEADE